MMRASSARSGYDRRFIIVTIWNQWGFDDGDRDA
jgi:hypothetical protein